MYYLATDKICVWEGYIGFWLCTWSSIWLCDILTISPPPLPSFVIIVIGSQFSDQYQYLRNCPPTPPLTHQQSIDNKSGLMLG